MAYQESKNPIQLISESVTLGYVEKTTTYSIDEKDYCIDCTSGTFTVTLPTAVGVSGKIYNVKNSGTGVITINTTSSQTIDEALTQSLIQGESLTVQSNNSNWIVL